MGHFMLRSRGRWPLALGLSAILVFSGCGGSDSGGENADAKSADGKAEDKADETGTPVNITNFLFEPMELEVPAGTKVTWTNQDDAPHNVQDLSDLNTPISPEMNKGDRFSITYPKAGSYPYVCGLHTYMTGTIKVT